MNLKEMTKAFPGKMRESGDEEYGKMLECAGMLEKYVDGVPRESGCSRFSPEDMSRWKEDYFRNLVHGGPQLPDDQFYTGRADTESNLGIGTDGEFTCEELFQFLYRLYKAISYHRLASAGPDAVMKNADLFGCADMLEKYVSRFPAAKGCVTLDGEDLSIWKQKYFPSLVESGPGLPDYSFFRPSDKSYGIGLDGSFHARELFHFLYRVYKEIAARLG